MKLNMGGSSKVISIVGHLKNGELYSRLFVYISLLMLVADTVYKYAFDISFMNRENCILYMYLPQWSFLIYEYFIELILVVIVGIFFAAVLEKHFTKLGRLMPTNSFTAFLYASVIPVCSCSVVPLIKTMHERIPFRVIITFIVAAPLLNPYIVMLSVTVLGVKYAIIRIICSLILAVATGFITEIFYKKMKDNNIQLPETCMIKSGCPMQKGTVFQNTWSSFKKIFPYIILAGMLGVGVELLLPGKIIASLDFSNNIIGTLLVILVGVPVYFCNGADVLFLQPLMHIGNLPLETAMAFSLTSTSVCITSLVLFAKFIGKRLTGIVLASIIVITLLLTILMGFVPSNILT